MIHKAMLLMILLLIMVVESQVRFKIIVPAVVEKCLVVSTLLERVRVDGKLRHPNIHESFLYLFNSKNFINFELGAKNVTISMIKIWISHYESKIKLVFSVFKKI